MEPELEDIPDAFRAVAEPDPMDFGAADKAAGLMWLFSLMMAFFLNGVLQACILALALVAGFLHGHAVAWRSWMKPNLRLMSERLRWMEQQGNLTARQQAQHDQLQAEIERRLRS